MDSDFTPKPHKEAVALIAGKPAVTKKVFNQLLPELKARAFTVAGIASIDALQRIRDAVASVPLGGEDGQTWDQAKRQIVDELDPYLGDGAEWRATLIMRTNGFQAFSSSIHRVGMEDEDTTHFQYLHGECEVPTPSHLALNGIILPKTDPFWETHTGPWGHLGCVCYKRPMNEDFVADEKVKDEKRNPDDRLVIEGPALKQLHHGDILRGGRHYDVNLDGPDNSGFKWSPDDFKIPLKELEKRYDPEEWSEFQHWAMGQKLNEQQTVWDWLSEVGPAPQPSPPVPVPALAQPPDTLPPEPEPPVDPFAGILAKFKAARISKVVMDKIADLPPSVAPLLDDLNVRLTKGGAHYSPSSNTIALQRDPDKWSGMPDTAVHEVGHHLHYKTGTITSYKTDPKFEAAALADWNAFQVWAAKHIGPNWRADLRRGPAAVETMGKALGYTKEYGLLPMSDQKRIVRFTDTIMGLSNAEYGFGHDRAYMKVNGLKEVFTHAWTAIVDRDETFVNLFSGVTKEVMRALKL